jgi:hypothetical protein
MKARDPHWRHEDLIAAMSYDPATGIFTARITTGNRRAGMAAGTLHASGYEVIKFQGRSVYAQRMAWFWVYGVWPPTELDHINGDKADNRIANLRPATKVQNSMNRGANKNNAAGVKGVCWRPDTGRWRAYITINGRKKSLGSFDDIEDAAAAYRTAATKSVGEFARV